MSKFKPKPGKRKTAPTGSTVTADIESATTDFFVKKRNIQFVTSQGTFACKTEQEATPRGGPSAQTINLDTSSECSTSSNEEANSGSTKERQKKRTKLKHLHSPTNRSEVQNSTAESEEDVLDPGKSRAKRKGKVVQPQSREYRRALTPPNALPEYILRDAQRQLEYHSAEIAASRHLHYEQPGAIGATDLEDLELQRFAEALNRSAATSAARTISANSSSRANRNVEVQITVHMVAYADPTKYTSMSGNLRNMIAEWESPLSWLMNSSDSFQDLFEHICQKKMVMRDELVLTFNNVQIWSTATPDSLRIHSTAAFKGFKSLIYKEILEKRNRRPASLDHPGPATDDLANTSSPAAATQSMSLTVRAKDLPSIQLTVDPSHLFRGVLKHYLKRVGRLSEGWQQTCRLEFDNEPLDLNSRVNSTEVEDNDLLEAILP